MMKPFSRIASLAMVLLLSLPAAGLAQSASAPPSAAAPAPNPPPDNAAQQRVEARIKQLHAQLHITSAQEPQWDQFAQTMRDNARDIDEAAMRRAQQFPTMTAVENMQSYEKLAEAHVQHLQKLIPTFQAVYDAMSPDQKKVADQVFRASAQAHAQARSGGNQAGARMAQVSARERHGHYWRYHGWPEHDWESEQLNHQELERLGVLPH